MSHEVESMFYQHNPPWHGLGTYVDHAPSASEAMEAAGLSWDVELQSVYVQKDNKGFKEVSSEESMFHKAVVRETDGRVLGIVGGQYTPLQNREAFRFFDPFVEEGHFQYETAGSLKGGRRVWVLASLSNGLREVVKDDPVKGHILLSNTHDGTTPVISMLTDVRVVCWNTMQMALSEGSNRSTVRHTRNLTNRMENMQEVITAAHNSFEKALEQYRFLASVQLNTVALEHFIKAVYGKNKDDELPKGGAQIINLFENGQGNNLPAARHTMWAAYNAVTEYVDHHRNSNSLDKRLESAWFGQGSELKATALQVALKGAMALAA